MTTALLVIDMQVALVEGLPAAQNHDALLATISALLGQARAIGAPIVYVQDKDVGAGVGSTGWQIHPALEPHAGELIVQKPYGDAFFQTTLHDELQARGIDQLVITGMKTEVCVDLSSRRAIALGYGVTLVADGHSTTDADYLSAAQVITYHNELLYGFGAEDGFGGGERWIVVKPAREITFETITRDN